VAAEAGIERVIAGVLPDGKRDVVAQLQSEGETVAMVGDGVNDAPALAQADLGLAIGTGTDIAIEASDLTLVSGDLGAAVDAIRLSRRTLRTIKENLFWAFAYNVAAIPLAVAGLLSPIVAASTRVDRSGSSRYTEHTSLAKRCWMRRTMLPSVSEGLPLCETSRLISSSVNNREVSGVATDRAQQAQCQPSRVSARSARRFGARGCRRSPHFCCGRIAILQGCRLSIDCHMRERR
jgi:hypothetical protein